MKNYIKIDGNKIPISEETARELKKSFGCRISLPCPIKMGFSLLNGGDKLSIPFPNSQRELFYSDGVGDYLVGVLNKQDLVDCVLTPCEREDLKPGDTAFYKDDTAFGFEELDYYCKILTPEKYVIIQGGEDVITETFEWKIWYKVVKL